MQTKLTLMSVIAAASLVALAQNTETAVQTNSRSWTGLLVAAGCQSTNNMARNTLASETSVPMKRTTSGEANKPYEEQQNEADRSKTARARESVPAATDTVSTPPVDAENTRGSAPLNDPMQDAKMMASKMDRSCRIGQKTTAFAFQTEDGRLIMLDDASNARVASQLASTDRLKHTNKIFRAQVKGSLQGEMMHVDSIKI